MRNANQRIFLVNGSGRPTDYQDGTLDHYLLTVQPPFRAERTHAYYRDSLIRFYTYLGQSLGAAPRSVTPEHITAKAIAGWLAELAKRVSRNTVANQWRAIRAYCNWMEREGYVNNGPDRCFHCKTELYGLLAALARERDITYVVDGCNVDDTGDHRPGRIAAAEHGVRSPLIEAGLT